ncbi:porin [Oleiagrimonas sp. MCCC 1A03011]|uniref:porin n=1 Tax=Oleiagrimonas sp. MCCC 1A03011 TaxID=1926883 RepID=UPI000DC5BE26|nr:porin [Oleiagrimonas sp. MCCC 1A03011]RAP59245.1 hypothetical protein BTJ49_00760 [Oleiagrimonas sp. MCCC 1A03011]
MKRTKRILPVAVIAALMGLSTPAFATGHIDNDELLRLVKQQAAQIKALQARLAVIEDRESQPSTSKDGAAPVHGAGNTAAATAAPSAAGHADSVRWGGHGEAGPVFSSDDGFFTFAPAGRLLVDYTATRGSSDPGRNINGSRVTDARLGAKGTMGALGYYVQVKFTDGKAGLRQAYLSYSTPLLGHHAVFYLGNFFKDLGIDGSSASVNLPFMLRDAATMVGEPVNRYYGLGMQMRMYGDNWHYSLSVSGDAPGNASNGSTSDSVVYLTRAHWNPIKTDAGFMHVGAWYYYEHLSPGVASINDHPSIALDFNENLDVKAGAVPDPTQDHATGYELGGVYRSFWAVGEYARRSVDSASVGTARRHGSSLSAGWMITGEKPGFSSRGGNWQWVRVNHPVTSGGWGAFELATRVDHYDYRGGAPFGGDGQSYTLGVNWYLNDWSRVMFNYIRWHTDNRIGDTGSDWGHSFGLRTQLMF